MTIFILGELLLYLILTGLKYFPFRFICAYLPDAFLSLNRAISEETLFEVIWPNLTLTFKSVCWKMQTPDH